MNLGFFRIQAQRLAYTIYRLVGLALFREREPGIGVRGDRTRVEANHVRERCRGLVQSALTRERQTQLVSSLPPSPV